MNLGYITKIILVEYLTL